MLKFYAILCRLWWCQNKVLSDFPTGNEFSFAFTHIFIFVVIFPHSHFIHSVVYSPFANASSTKILYIKSIHSTVNFIAPTIYFVHREYLPKQLNQPEKPNLKCEVFVSFPSSSAFLSFFKANIYACGHKNYRLLRVWWALMWFTDFIFNVCDVEEIKWICDRRTVSIENNTKIIHTHAQLKLTHEFRVELWDKLI